MASELVTPSVLVEERCILKFLAKVKPGESLHLQYHSHHYHHYRNNWQNERIGLSFTIAAGPRQGGDSQVRVPRDSWPYFAVSDPRLPQPDGPGHLTYIPQDQGGPVISPGIGFPFRRLLELGRATMEVFKPASTHPTYNSSARTTVENTVSSCTSIYLCWFFVVERCLFKIRYLCADVFICDPLPSNGSTRYIILCSTSYFLHVHITPPVFVSVLLLTQCSLTNLGTKTRSLWRKSTNDNNKTNVIYIYLGECSKTYAVNSSSR
jgi:hypothetical protein